MYLSHSGKRGQLADRYSRSPADFCLLPGLKPLAQSAYLVFTRLGASVATYIGAPLPVAQRKRG